MGREIFAVPRTRLLLSIQHHQKADPLTSVFMTPVWYLRQPSSGFTSAIMHYHPPALTVQGTRIGTSKKQQSNNMRMSEGEREGELDESSTFLIKYAGCYCPWKYPHHHTAPFCRYQMVGT